MKYIALLRGINVGGNNKVHMSDLKTCFASAGFQNVTTYINSGNILFDSEESNLTLLTTLCITTFENFFHFSVSIVLLTADSLREALAQAPDWWDADKTSKHNTIFIIPPATATEIIDSIGNIAPEYEKVATTGIFPNYLISL